MAQIFVLILVVFIPNQAVTTTSVEFGSKPACSAAGSATKKKIEAANPNNRVEFTCSSKF